MKTSLQIERQHRSLKAQELIDFSERARAAAKLRGTVSILIASSEQMHAMNRSFRRKDRPTDVLSFPPSKAVESFHAGDIAISADIAIENASRFGHSPADEVKILILHGMLHLAGHDHETDQGQMARQEKKLRTALGLNNSLIDRTHADVARPAQAKGKSVASSKGAKMKPKKIKVAPKTEATKRRTSGKRQSATK